MNDIPDTLSDLLESKAMLSLDSQRFFTFLNTITERETKLTRAAAVIQDFLETMASEVAIPLEVFANAEEKIESVREAILEIIGSIDRVDDIWPEVEYFSRQITSAIALLRVDVEKLIASQNAVLSAARESETSIEIALRDERITQPHQRIKNITTWLDYFKSPEDLVIAPEGIDLNLIQEFVDFAAKANTGHNDFNRGNFGNLVEVLKAINEIVETNNELYSEVIDDLSNLMFLIVQKLFVIGKDGAMRNEHVSELLDQLAPNLDTATTTSDGKIPAWTDVSES